MRSGVVCGTLLVVGWIAPPPVTTQVAEDARVAYPHASGCYAGELCRGNGQGVAVRVRPRPLRTIRFYAHDRVGETSRGRLRVRLDHHVLARELDIPRDGAVIELDAAGLAGHDLHLEVLGDEEIVVEDLEIRYGLRDSPLP